VLIERWRALYNTIRPHITLGYWPPVPRAIFGAKGRFAHLSSPPNTWLD